MRAVRGSHEPVDVGSERRQALGALGASSPPPERPRFLSEADCRAISARLARVAQGGGYTAVHLVSVWRGTMRWARNELSTSGETRDNFILVRRAIRGAMAEVVINTTTEAALVAAARAAERLAALRPEQAGSDLVTRRPLEPHTTPALFSEATYQLDAERRAQAALGLLQTARAAGMLSAGNIEVVARSTGTFDTLGRALYFPYTEAQCSMTVRNPTGTGSGWAGDSHYDWAQLDGAQLAATALAKCLKSQHPARIEPGRYTTILEPQAVGDLVGQLLASSGFGLQPMDLSPNVWRTNAGPGPFNVEIGESHNVGHPGKTLLGQQVMDARLSVRADPLDPALGVPPYYLSDQLTAPDLFDQPVYHPVTWVEHGVLTHLGYPRGQGIRDFAQDTGLPNSGAFRIDVSGTPTPLAEMIATTKRGLLVTRFDRIELGYWTSQLYRGYTRDGLWLIENGKITKAVANMVFVESVLQALNSVEQVGAPQRVYRPGYGGTGLRSHPQPAIVPALKIRDFSFTALTDAV